MSKTKLMKLGSERSHFNRRGLGKKNAKGKGVPAKPGGVQKRKQRSNAKGLCVLRKELLNPPKETMIPITYKDFVNMGTYSRKPDADYKLSKYHEKLVLSGTEVTRQALNKKYVEILDSLGYARAECTTLYSNAVPKFLVRCGSFRAAKLRGFNTDQTSLTKFQKTYLNEVLQMEPASGKSRVAQSRPKQCTCGHSTQISTSAANQKDLSAPIPTLVPESPSKTAKSPVKETISSPTTNVPENGPSLLSLFATSPTSEHKVTEAPSLLNLFSPVPSTSYLENETLPKSSNHTGETEDLNESYFSNNIIKSVTLEPEVAKPSVPKKVQKVDRKKLCGYCLRQIKNKSYATQFMIRVEIDYAFPELLPKQKVQKNGFHQDSTSFHTADLLQDEFGDIEPMACDDDDVYSQLFDKLKSAS